MNTIQSISQGVSYNIGEEVIGEGISRGAQLEIILTNVCNNLSMAGSLTEHKADLEFVLGVVGSYLISTQNSTLGIDAEPPRVIFDETLFPILDNMEEVIVEKIEDGE